MCDLQAQMHMNHLCAGGCIALLWCAELRVFSTPSVHSKAAHRTTIAIHPTTDRESPKGHLGHAWAHLLSSLTTGSLGGLLTWFSGYGWVETVWKVEHELAACPGDQGGQKNPGLYQE